MRVGRLISQIRAVARSRLFLAALALAALTLILVVVVPSPLAKAAIAALGFAGAVPLLTVSMVRMMELRTRQEIVRRSRELDELRKGLHRHLELIDRRWDDDRLRRDARIERIEAAVEALGARLTQIETSLSTGPLASAETSLKALEASLTAVDARVERIEAWWRTQSGEVSAAEQLSVTRAALSSASSALVIHGGAGAAEYCSLLKLGDRTAIIDADHISRHGQGPTEPPTEVDLLVVVAGSRVDLGWIADGMPLLPRAGRIIITVLSSTRVLPLPVVPTSPHDHVSRLRIVQGERQGWTVDVTLARPGPTERYVRSSAQLCRVSPDHRRAYPLMANGAGDARPAASRVISPRPGLISPVGFVKDPDEGMAMLTHPAAGDLAVVYRDQAVLSFGAAPRVTEAHIAALRRFRGVAVDGACPQAQPGTPFCGECEVVLTALAMAGVPLSAAQSPPRGVPVDTPMAQLIFSTNPESLADSLAREEHSIRLRRLGARMAAGEATSASLPARVSVLLSTRREEMLSHVAAQLKRQRGVDFELIVGLHGSWREPSVARRTFVNAVKHCTVMEIPEDVGFSQALNQLAAAASGTVLIKVDDDDFYGPDFLYDLLLARQYSCADIVAGASEFVFLEDLNMTIRRSFWTEVYGQPGSGTALLIDRAAFDAVGGFRPELRAGADIQLQRDVMDAGGMVYRTHGLNFIVLRRPSGHTWQVDQEYHLRAAIQSWPGLRGSSLYDSDAT